MVSPAMRVLAACRGRWNGFYIPQEARKVICGREYFLYLNLTTVGSHMRRNLKIQDRLGINTWTDFPVNDNSVLNGHLSQPNHFIIPLKGHVSETLKDPTRGQVHFWIREFGAGNGDYFTKKKKLCFWLTLGSNPDEGVALRQGLEPADLQGVMGWPPHPPGLGAQVWGCSGRITCFAVFDTSSLHFSLL